MSWLYVFLFITLLRGFVATLNLRMLLTWYPVSKKDPDFTNPNQLNEPSTRY
jgi:hypothetical protein